MSRLVTIKQGKKTRDFSVSEMEGWMDVAVCIRELLSPGSIVTLSGPLGAGKTTFVQVLATELGIRERPLSPTFALMRSYRLPKPINGVSRLVHVDAYRIEDERDLMPLDLEYELSDGKSALVLEWPEQVSGWLKKQSNLIRLTISL